MPRRPVDLVFWCLAALLVAMPLVLVKPGWPAGLKSDEPAYYLMALSLAKDGDLVCDLGDIQRLFREFPYQAVHNLILSTDDGWNTVYFGKPYIYSFFAAPVAGLFGGSGMVALNMALLLLMVWLGARYLERRGNDPGLALLFSFGFFFLSCGYSYVFWLHPEIFNMAAVMVSLYFGLTEPVRQSWGPFARTDFRQALSGAALILAVYNKPMVLALCLPPLVRALTRRRLREAVMWGVGAGLSLLLTMGVAMALMGHPSAYLMARGGQKVCSDDVMPIQPVAPPPAPVVSEGAAEGGDAAEAPAKRPKASWYWLLRIPRPHPAMVIENLGNFLWGRHTGLFLYFPFAALTVLLFLVHRRRDPVAWATLVALATVALYFLLWIPFNYQGGGGFVGNRYFVNAYPGFLFLVGTLAPRGLTLLGYLLGGLLLGPTLFSPFGRAVPAPTLQAHVRNFPFPYFPRELSLREVPGYEQRIWGGSLVSGRSDVFLPRGPRFWAHGAVTTEVMIQSETPFESLAFDVVSPVTPNRITLRLGDVEQTFAVGKEVKGVPRKRLVLRPEGPYKRRRVKDTWVYVYRLEVEAERGQPRTWDRNFPPQDCFEFAYNETIQESFYTGADIAFLGPAELLDRDLYAVEWGEVKVPATVAAGEIFTLETRVTNRSEFPWPSEPPVRVALSYRFYDAAGEMAVANGLRTHPEKPVQPGETFGVRQEVMAPEEPGSYTLELDLVYEMVAWFTDRNDGHTLRAPVEVTAPRASPPTESTGDENP